MIPETATQAAANAFSLEVQKFPLEQCDPYMREEYTEIASNALTAALPHIEAELRTQIADDIRELLTRGTPKTPRNRAVEHAARIAEGTNQ